MVDFMLLRLSDKVCLFLLMPPSADNSSTILSATFHQEEDKKKRLREEHGSSQWQLWTRARKEMTEVEAIPLSLKF